MPTAGLWQPMQSRKFRIIPGDRTLPRVEHDLGAGVGDDDGLGLSLVPGVVVADPVGAILDQRGGRGVDVHEEAGLDELAVEDEVFDHHRPDREYPFARIGGTVRNAHR